MHDIWTEYVRKNFEPTPEEQAKDWDKEIAAYRGGYVGIVKHRAFENLVGQILELIFGVIFFAGGRMLLGMGLMKLGVFSASRSRRFYARMVALGYGIGLPLMVFDALQLIDTSSRSMYELHGGDVLQRFRQPDRGPGPRRAYHADRAVRRDRRGSPAGWPPWAAWR